MKSHKQVLDELELSIVKFVLASPRLEHEVVSNFLDRNGFVVQDEKESTKELHRKYGLGLPDKKHLAWTAERKAKAVELYKSIKKTSFVK